jgi:ABC-type multidrug transport system ATPase subunit
MSPTKGGVVARGLGLRTRAGLVYRNVDLEVPPGALAVVTGPAGCGKTALLLTLAGRMRASEGEHSVAGIAAAERFGALRRRAGLGEFRGVNDLDDTLTVNDVVMGELALHRRVTRKKLVAPVLASVDLNVPPHAKVGDLGAAERTLLGASLGCIGEPALLVIDELDGNATSEEATRVLAALRRLAGTGIAVVAGALDPMLASAADISLALSADGSAVLPDASICTHEVADRSEPVEVENALV